MGKPCCVFLQGCRAEVEQGHGGRPGGAVQRARGRPSHPVLSSPAPWEQPAQPDSCTSLLQQFGSFVTKHGGKHSVKAAQRFPPPPLLPLCRYLWMCRNVSGACPAPQTQRGPQCGILSQSNLAQRWHFLCDYRDLTKQDITVAQRGFFRYLYFKENGSACCHSVLMQIPEQYNKPLHCMFLPAVVWVQTHRVPCGFVNLFCATLGCETQRLQLLIPMDSCWAPSSVLPSCRGLWCKRNLSIDVSPLLEDLPFFLASSVWPGAVSPYTHPTIPGL